MPPIPLSRAEPAIAARWRDAGRSLAVSAGMERSARFSQSGLDDSRYLITLSGQPWWRDDRLAALLDDVHFPAALNQPLAQALAQARFLHLGYEQRDGAPVLKLYCEFVLAGNGRLHAHRAFKWQPVAAGAFACDDYWLHPPMTADGARAHLAGVAPQTLVSALGPLLEQAAPRMPEGFMVLDVERDGARRSCDVRLYDAELAVADAGNAVTQAANFLGCEAASWLAAHGQAPLGHISAGHTGAGAPFLTVYHGAGPL